MTAAARRDFPRVASPCASWASGDETENSVLELTFNWDNAQLRLVTAMATRPSAFEDITALAAIRTKAGKVGAAPGPMKAAAKQL